MKSIRVKNWWLDVDKDFHLTDYMEESLELLFSNHLYNCNTDWERYRKYKKRPR